MIDVVVNSSTGPDIGNPDITDDVIGPGAAVTSNDVIISVVSSYDVVYDEPEDVTSTFVE